MRRKLAIVGVSVAALAAAAVGLGFEAFDDEETISGPNADHAGAAALRATGGGELLAVEDGDDGGSVYEVEIRRSDGTIAEVLLGGDFKVMQVIEDADD
jgi:hypothetical protein